MDVITVCSFTISGLQQGIDKIAKFCKKWSLNCTHPPHPNSDGCQERGENLKGMTLGAWKDKSWKW